MSIYEKIQQMSKEEFAEFCFTLYNKGWFDGSKGIDDELWVRSRIADCDYDYFNTVLV